MVRARQRSSRSGRSCRSGAQTASTRERSACWSGAASRALQHSGRRSGPRCTGAAFISWTARTPPQHPLSTMYGAQTGATQQSLLQISQVVSLKPDFIWCRHDRCHPARTFWGPVTPVQGCYVGCGCSPAGGWPISLPALQLL